MKTVFNSKNFKFISKSATGYIVYCDTQYNKNTTEGIELVSAEAIEIKGKPSLAKTKNAILNYYNSKISDKLVNGFVWDGYSVGLTETDQMNYKAACDLAVQTSGKSLPVTFKFKNGNENVYYTFSTVDEILNFWTAANKHITDTLVEGWKEKEKIDFNNYK